MSAATPEIICVRAQPLIDSLWLGTISWIACAMFGRFTLASDILLFAALVIVSLGLELIAPETLSNQSRRLLAAVRENEKKPMPRWLSHNRRCCQLLCCAAKPV